VGLRFGTGGAVDGAVPGGISGFPITLQNNRLRGIAIAPDSARCLIFTEAVQFSGKRARRAERPSEKIPGSMQHMNPGALRKQIGIIFKL
jgi:hypothetical protein